MNQRASLRLVVWSALLMSVVLYLVIAWITVAPKTTASLEDGLRNPVVLVLYAASVMAFFAGFAIPRMLAPRQPEFPQRPDPAAPPLAPSQIVQWAIFESAAIFGLVAAFVSGIWTVALPPVVLAITAFVMTMPKSER